MRKDIQAAIDLVTAAGYLALPPDHLDQGWRVFRPKESLMDALGYVPTRNTEILLSAMFANEWQQGVVKARLRAVCAKEWGIPPGSFGDAWRRLEAAKVLVRIDPDLERYRYEP